MLTDQTSQEPAPLSNLSAEKMAGIAERFFGRRLRDSDLQAVTGLLNAIRSESREMRQFEVGDMEPATLYQIDEQ